jgi:hypothetical protein
MTGFGAFGLYRDLARILGRLTDSSAWRDRLIRDVEAHYGITLPVERGGNRQWDLQSIAEACDRYPDGLRVLLRAVGEDYEGTVVLAEAWQLVDQCCPVPLLTDGERRELCALLLDDAVTTELTTLSRYAFELLGRAGEGDDSWTGRAERLVRDLEDDVEVEGRAPALMTFVERVAAGERPALREALRRWNNRVARRLGWPPGLLTATREREAAGAGLPVGERSLVVEISSRRAAAALFSIRARLMDDRSREFPLLCDDRARGRDELEARVAAVHREAIERLGLLAPGLQVEFVLPLHLIWLDVDRFEVRPTGLSPRPIGEDHTVVVRPWERLRLPHVNHHLRGRWHWLQSHGREYQEEAVEWVDPGEVLEPKGLRRRLRHAKTPVCFVLFEPPRHTGDEATDYLSVLLEAGIPALVGVRSGGETDAGRQEIRNFLRTALTDLPERVRLLRGGLRPGGNGEMLSADLDVDLSLVWDSPDGLEELRSVLLHPPIRGDHDRSA